MNKRINLFKAVLVLALASLACSVSGVEGVGDVIHVTKTADTNGECTESDCSFREAIALANERPGHDRIVLKSDVYPLNYGVVENFEDGEGTIEFPTLVITDDVLIEGTFAENTIIDGSELANRSLGPEVFLVAAEATVEFMNLSIRSIQLVHYQGGAVNNKGELTLRNVNISEITGAAALLNEGTMTLENVTMEENFGWRAGGVMNLVSGNLTVQDSHFESNGSRHNAGAIYNAGIVEIESSEFLANSASGGGGGAIHNLSSGQVQIQGSYFALNQSPGSGGAIMNAIEGVAIINGSTFNLNLANEGGAVYTASESYFEMENSTVVNNHGGAIFNSGGQALLHFNTISNNQNGPGIHGARGDTYIRNTIVAGNPDAECVGEVISEGHNLIGDESCGFPGPGDIHNADAMLGSPVTFGILFGLPLEPGSPAINAAENLNCPDVDERGTARPQGGNCDIGALEFSLEGSLTAPTSPPVLGEEAQPTLAAPTSQVTDCTFTASLNLFCRQGPGSSLYPELDSFVPEQSALVVGQSQDGDFVYVTGPNNGTTCVVPSSEDFGQITGSCEDLPDLTPPPLPPTETPTPTPEEPEDVPDPTQAAPTTAATQAPTGSISGVVWQDTNVDGKHQGSEPGYGGVTVRLGQGECSSTGLMTTVTSGNGSYSFTGLAAGTYCVSVNVGTACGDYTAPATPTEYTVTLDAGDDADSEFGFQIRIC